MKAPRKAGRTKSVVHVIGIEKGMTLNQFKKYSLKELQTTHITKSQIIQTKILTEAQLNKYIEDGTLSTVNHTNKVFFDREAVFKLV